MKKASDSDWVVFTLTFVGSALAVIALSVLLLSADQCSATLAHCMGAEKLRAKIMLVLSAGWFCYLVFRFARDPHRF